MRIIRPIFTIVKLIAFDLLYQGLKVYVDTKLSETTLGCHLKFALKVFDPAVPMAVGGLWVDSKSWAEPFKNWVSTKSLQVGFSAGIGSTAKEASKAILQCSGVESIEPEWYVPIKLFSKHTIKGYCQKYLGPVGGAMCSLGGELFGNIFTNYLKEKDLLLTETDAEYSLIITTNTRELSYALDSYVDEDMNGLEPFSRAYYHSIGTGLLRIIAKPEPYFKCMKEAQKELPEHSNEKPQFGNHDSNMDRGISQMFNYKADLLEKCELEKPYEAIKWTDFPSKQHEELCLNYEEQIDSLPENYELEDSHKATEEGELSIEAPEDPYIEH